MKDFLGIKKISQIFVHRKNK